MSDVSEHTLPHPGTDSVPFLDSTPAAAPRKSPPDVSLRDDAVHIVPPDDRCANCNAERMGAYCHECGQRLHHERLTVRRFLRDLAARLLDLESGLAHTAWRLTVAPGTVSRDFVTGRRKRYAGPGTYLVVVATLSILLFALVEESYVQFIKEAWGPGLADASSDGILADVDSETFATTFTHWLNQGVVYLSLVMAGAFAVLVRWLVPEWRRCYNVAESCVFAVYTTAHGFLLCLPLYALLFVDTDMVRSITMMSWGMMAVTTGYVAVAARQFLNRRWTTVVMTGLAYLVTYLLFMFVAAAVGFVVAFLVAS